MAGSIALATTLRAASKKVTLAPFVRNPHEPLLRMYTDTESRAYSACKSTDHQGLAATAADAPLLMPIVAM